MCIVVDICCIPSVFKSTSENHSNFRPVLLWIIKGKGKLVYGGSKYNKELKAICSYLRIFAQLEKAGKVKRLDDVKVDERQKEVEVIANDDKCNDAHIIAIIGVSGCKLLCTVDKKAMNPYFKQSDLYPKGISRPKIYSGRPQNLDLLCDANIVEICKPTNKGSRELRGLGFLGEASKEWN